MLLQGQLSAKDEQITDFTAELAKEREHSREQSDKIAVLVNQSQKLQLAQMKPYLTDGIADPQETEAPPEKPRLFQRLFEKSNK